MLRIAARAKLPTFKSLQRNRIFDRIELIATLAEDYVSWLFRRLQKFSLLVVLFDRTLEHCYDFI